MTERRYYEVTRPVTDPLGNVLATPGEVCSDLVAELLEELGDAVTPIGVHRFRSVRSKKGTSKLGKAKPLSVLERAAVDAAKAQAARGTRRAARKAEASAEE